ncbi:TadE/TadG family type IV pilus assembly protein [Streptacidiphilus sp. MAP12-16]|uniref:TadE/TadG family type IV pilus assembly protein n=1 Tax=Streptacidiphilus sp. MAP12-16 TaxID=3156300 RepID=UPI0035164FB9
MRDPRVRDRGAASSEIAVVMPLLLLMLMGIVQVSLIVHAHHVAQAVAAQAVDAARAQGGTNAQGRADAQALLASLGTGALGRPQITVRRTATTVTAQVVGDVSGVVPFWTPQVIGYAAGPVERLTQPAR